MTEGSGPFTVVVCTRDRPRQLAETLAALERQTRRDFEVMVVDQGDAPVLERPGVRVIADSGRGLSRARNAGIAAATSDWIAFVDDDCLTDPDWAEELAREIQEHPDSWLVSGHVGERATPGGEYLRVSVFEVEAARTLAGRRVRPWDIGLGVCFAVRRDVVEQLGGFDERLGAGAPDFPAADDMDFNYRLLAAGGSARVTPRVRSFHDQWRTPAELAPLYRGYMKAWAAFAMKHLRTGDVRGGLWLWSLGFRDFARMLASSLRRRSLLRLRVAGAKLRGLVEGTLKGLLRSW